VTPSRVEGTVFLPTGQPAKNAQLTLESLRQPGLNDIFSFRGRSRVKSGADGSFTLEDLAAGRYRIKATLGNFEGRSGEIEIGPGENRRGVRIDLESPTELVIQVTDAAGAPVAGARIFLRSGSTGRGSAATDAEGEAVLLALPGNYTLMVMKQGESPVEREITVGRGGSQTVPLRLE
jgi:carboxypeptidase family protein